MAKVEAKAKRPVAVAKICGRQIWQPDGEIFYRDACMITKLTSCFIIFAEYSIYNYKTRNC